MTKRLKRVSPVQAGIVLAALYGIISLIFVPFFILAILFGGKMGGKVGAGIGVGFAIFLPVLYAAFGFIGGLIGAAIYNLIAEWTGGLEFEVEDVAMM